MLIRKVISKKNFLVEGMLYKVIVSQFFKKLLEQGLPRPNKIFKILHNFPIIIPPVNFLVRCVVQLFYLNSTIGGIPRRKIALTLCSRCYFLSSTLFIKRQYLLSISIASSSLGSARRRAHNLQLPWFYASNYGQTFLTRVKHL